MQPGTQTVQDVIDARPIGPRQWVVFALCFAVAILDGFDTQVVAFTGPAIARAFAMTPVHVAYIFAGGTLGMALGAMALGALGDRIGRRPAILIAVAWFALFTIGVAFAAAPWQIVVLRFLTGIGMGGATPAFLALASEYAPGRRKSLVLTCVILGLPLGAVIGGFVAARWMGAIGWEGIYLVGGGVPLLCLLVLALVLPESPQFLIARGRPGDEARGRALLARLMPRGEGGAALPARLATAIATGAPRGATSVRALFSPAYRTTTVAVWATYLFAWIAWFMFLLWLPSVLGLLGVPPASAAYGTVIVNTAFLVYAIPLSLLVPLVGARRMMVAICLLGIVICAGFAVSLDNPTALMVLAAAAGLGLGGQQLVLNYLIAVLYPTDLRATALGWSIGLGRTGAIIGSALGGLVLQNGNPQAFFLTLIVPLLIAIAAVGLLRPRAGAVPDAAGARAAH